MIEQYEVIKFTNSPEEGDALLKQLKKLQRCAFKVVSTLMIDLIRTIFYSIRSIELSKKTYK